MYYAESCNEFAGLISASLRTGNTASIEETSQRWRAAGSTVSHLTGPTFNIRPFTPETTTCYCFINWRLQLLQLLYNSKIKSLNQWIQFIYFNRFSDLENKNLITCGLTSIYIGSYDPLTLSWSMMTSDIFSHVFNGYKVLILVYRNSIACQTNHNVLYCVAWCFRKCCVFPINPFFCLSYLKQNENWKKYAMKMYNVC